MFETLSIFKTANAMAKHAGARQSLLAQNMANADTPGYLARDMHSFSDMATATGPGTALQSTRSTHLNASESANPAPIFERSDERNPNGNSVSLEIEMMHAVDTKRQHDRALSIYKSSLQILRTTLGRG